MVVRVSWNPQGKHSAWGLVHSSCPSRWQAPLLLPGQGCHPPQLTSHRLPSAWYGCLKIGFMAQCIVPSHKDVTFDHIVTSVGISFLFRS